MDDGYTSYELKLIDDCAALLVSLKDMIKLAEELRPSWDEVDALRVQMATAIMHSVEAE